MSAPNGLALRQSNGERCERGETVIRPPIAPGRGANARRDADEERQQDRQQAHRDAHRQTLGDEFGHGEIALT